jgi:hypothetical protein
VAAMGILLSANSGYCHKVTNSFGLQPALDSIVTSYQMIGLSPSVIPSRRLIYMDKPHIFASGAETGFYNLKSKFPLNLKIQYRISGHMRQKDLKTVITFHPC